MSIERQTEEVDKVKRSANGIIVDPVTLPPDASVATRPRDDGAVRTSRGVPIIDATASWWASSPAATCGFSRTATQPIREVMTKDNLVTARGL